MRATKKFCRDNLTSLTFSFVVLAIHFVNNAFTTYGIFRDELYYIACSEHLAWGYVDQPPFCALVLFVQKALFGESLFALRLVPSFAHAFTVFITGIFVKKLHGDTLAEVLAMLCVAFAPGLMGMFGIYSMNSIEIVLWQLVFYCLLSLQETSNAKYWYIIGCLLGVGLMNKVSMGWLAAGIVIALLLTEQRKWFYTKYLRIAAGIAAVIFIPFIIWNIQHDFAHLEFMRRAATLKYASQDVGTFLFGLVMNSNPIASMIWLTGFVALFFGKQKNRFIGIIILTVFSILMINVHSKAEYFNPAIPMLFVFGSIVLTNWVAAHRRLKILGMSYLAILFVTGILITPLAIDILPVQTFINYTNALNLGSKTTEGYRMRELPQHFADRFGWRELANDVDKVFSTLSDTEQQHCAIYAQNYGEAGAIDFFGKNFGLPNAFSGHNSYYLWGKERLDDSISVLIAVGGSREDYLDTFEEIQQVAIHNSEYSMLYETNLPIFVCRKPKLRIKEVWHTTKNYI